MNNYEDVYKSPSADLQKDVTLPEAFCTAPFTAGKWRFIALLSLFYLIISLLGIGFYMVSGIEYENTNYLTIASVLSVTNTVMFVYLILMFRQLLHLRFDFNRADKHIQLLIGLYVLMEINSQLMSEGGSGVDVAGIVSQSLTIIFGVVLFLFGKRLLQIVEEYRGLKLYAWSILLTGLFMATVVAELLSIIPGAISDVAMMLVFFTAAKELKVAEASKLAQAAAG